MIEIKADSSARDFPLEFYGVKSSGEAATPMFQ
jgi:hypothetical protein